MDFRFGGRVLSAAFLTLTFALTVSAQSIQKIPTTPDPAKTPGDLCDVRDPDFKEHRYEAKIAYCVRNVSTEVKDRIYKQYGVPESQRRNYTIDHFIPLSIGGSNGEDNLWPEHKKIKETRLNLELEVYHAVRDGQMSQEAAIDRIEHAKMNPDL